MTDDALPIVPEIDRDDVSIAEMFAAQSNRPDGEVPTIKVVAGAVERIVDQAERALIVADRGLYQRDGRIVYVGDCTVVTAARLKIVAQRILDRGDYALLEDLGCAAKFTRYDVRAKADVSIDPPISIVKTLRQRVGRLRFDTLTGVISAPMLRDDGSLISVPGYDRATGLLYDPLGVEFPDIPARPTRAEAHDALVLLLDLISTFPFVDEVDLAVALSTIISALARRSVPTVPLHALTAHAAGSGKSMLVDLASIIAVGHEAGVISQGATDEELEKRLGSVLLAGDPIVAIDNCEHALGGKLLCQMLSQTRVMPRILGQSVSPTIINGQFITATGNNLTLIGDVTRRALLCRLDAKHERPELRVFERNPIALAKARRPEYVTAILTLLRAYHVAGKPDKPTPPLGSFEEWSDLVRGALLWLGCADPVESMERLREADPRRNELANVVAHWRDIIAFDKVTVADVIKTATERQADDGSEFQHPEFREALLTVAGNKGAINSRSLGNWLAKNAGKVVDGVRFQQIDQRNKVAVWQLSRLS